MSEKSAVHALTGLRWTLGVVILIEAALFLAPIGGYEFGRIHLPRALHLVLGWGEVIGAILVLVPRTIFVGGSILLVIFLLAIAVHLLHGMSDVGSLMIYAAIAWTLATVNRA